MVHDETICIKPSSFKLFLNLEEHLDFLELNAHKEISEDCVAAYFDLCAAKLNARQLKAISDSWQCRFIYTLTLFLIFFVEKSKVNKCEHTTVKFHLAYVAGNITKSLVIVQELLLY